MKCSAYQLSGTKSLNKAFATPKDSGEGQGVAYLINMPVALKYRHFQQLCCITLLILLY